DRSMPRKGKDWARSRGIGPGEREWNEPWERLRHHLVERHGERVDIARRLERPDPEDLRNLAILTRQASAAMDADVARLLATATPQLTPMELDTLRRIADKPSYGVNLAEYLRISTVRVCRILNRLEEAGLTVRSGTYLDGRVRRADITEDGRDYLDTVNTMLQDLAHQWLDEVDDGAERALVPLVATLADLT
ncbi:MAG TPA: MarR family winged helix-turn-helix transcriptional regulator, partial [Ornithinibacter sp.]|nr:MarR family winged helix-turn-helix transcriptional regulator [Ornithinibacter sp.]